jgi:hypothetical protein
MRYMELDFVFKFGKHAGKTLKEVIDCDIEYALWLNDPRTMIKYNLKINGGEAWDYFRDKCPVA